ncbi:hypothetical protein NJB14194_07890, partial [Mycobacterium montefiorense]
TLAHPSAGLNGLPSCLQRDARLVGHRPAGGSNAYAAP